MVQQHLVLPHASKQHQFCQKFEAEQQTFSQSQPKKWNGWAQMGTQELVSHHNITHWTHIWRTWNGSAASCTVKCLQLASSSAQILSQKTKLLANLRITAQKVA